MSEEDLTEFTRKGDAFVRYFYIDRGNEDELDIKEAMTDFENYIYRPIAQHVTSEIVTDVVDEALEAILEPGAKPEDLTGKDSDEVMSLIGYGFLKAYIALHGPAGE